MTDVLLTGVLIAVHVVQIAGLLAENNTVQPLVDEAVVVLDNLPNQLGGRHDTV